MLSALRRLTANLMQNCMVFYQWVLRAHQLATTWVEKQQELQSIELPPFQVYSPKALLCKAVVHGVDERRLGGKGG